MKMYKNIAGNVAKDNPFINDTVAFNDSPEAPNIWTTAVENNKSKTVKIIPAMAATMHVTEKLLFTLFSSAILLDATMEPPYEKTYAIVR